MFIPKAKFRGQPYAKPVLILWLKEQDAGGRPLTFLNDLVAHLSNALRPLSSQRTRQPEIRATYEVLGPRSSSGLSAMLKELQSAQRGAPPALDSLKGVRFFSPSATAEDTFLLDRPPAPETSRQTDESVEKLFARAQIRLTRTIGTDATLAEQLLQELKRRQVDLKPCAARDCNPKIALISEWDTLYGRSLPRTFAAVAMNQGSGTSSATLVAVGETACARRPELVRLAAAPGREPYARHEAARVRHTARRRGCGVWPVGARAEYLRRLYGGR